ncbi:phasin family protein [Polynucleobacter sp. Latsch14-2]|jgi:phasin family protein|uniref:phasin family protein n=1 Tax=Polynucleobacter sp. Latsch14-2 TaxID=2576920 RepID=UPI001C0CEC4F|nr:phasin family protein [Polynucleobacter sp. Latsch14-2]MBU3613870.1 phasin family protein [Polynucleobacter sp. Latsch14-2]
MNQDQITAKLSQINSKGLEASFSLSEAALENAQKLAELNYAASKDALVNVQDGIQQVLTAKDPKQVTEILSADALQAASNQAVAYQKKVSKVLRDSNKEFSNVVESSIDQLQDGFQDWINTVAANAPAGSDVFVSSFKTAYGSALQGFEQFRAASKEAFATAEKTADQAIDAVQGQIAQVKKAATPASRGRKAA